jgi:hypothetical protein
MTVAVGVDATLDEGLKKWMHSLVRKNGTTCNFYFREVQII